MDILRVVQDSERIFSYPFWNQVVFGNSLREYLIALLTFVFLLTIFKIIQLFVLQKLKQVTKKTNTDLDDMVITIVQTLPPPFYAFVAFYVALKLLVFPQTIQVMVDTILVVLIIFQIVRVVQIVLEYVLMKQFRGEDEISHSTLSLVKIILAVVLWIIGFLFILSNLGVNITSLVAGLGIGGIAVAFALQNILSDLFSSFAILFDKPFKEGDFVVVGDKKGTIKKIGIKTTRMKALDGEEIILSNQYLTSAQIQNYNPMEKRRVLFQIRVEYNTPISKIKKIPTILQKIIESADKTEFGRAHFQALDVSALVFEVVYFVQEADYNLYMDIQQSINLQIMEQFEKEKITFAQADHAFFASKIV